VNSPLLPATSLTGGNTVAFNHLGRNFLSVNDATWILLWFTDYQTDLGAQWIMADPEQDFQYSQFGTVTFEVDHQQKKSFFSGDTGEKYITYIALVTNVGPQSTWFSIQGGGNT
jgi:hypothetical protein